MNGIPHAVALYSHLHCIVSLCISIAFTSRDWGFKMKLQELHKLSELKEDIAFSGIFSMHVRYLSTQSPVV